MICLGVFASLSEIWDVNGGKMGTLGKGLLIDKTKAPWEKNNPSSFNIIMFSTDIWNSGAIL